jgi:23S rRNA U2552 (ribose-2'-O)-methylase RlmE/FtsJ
MIKEFAYKIPNGENNNLNKNNVIVKSSNFINKPQINLGFQYFLHRTKNSMSITKKISAKNKFYYVVNPYEHRINDYKDDLNNISKQYFNVNESSPKILSRAFYKLWEILLVFDLANEEKLTYAALAEGPGAFIQSVIHYRKKFYNNKKDRYFAVTIHPEKGKFIEMGKKFLNYYNEDNPKLLRIHKTYPIKKTLKHTSRDNGDLTQVKTIQNFKKDVLKSKKYANLVTADGGFEWNDENFQEQEAYRLVMGQIVSALRVQAKNGTFVLKLFESFTEVTLKMLYILSSFYEENYIYKPYYSRESNSEKYIICKKFKYDQVKDSKVLEDKLQSMELILENMNTKGYIYDILPNLKLPEEFRSTFRYLNISIANRQQIMINKLVTYIKENNYYGEKYHNYKNDQIESTKNWVSEYYPKDKKILTNKIKELASQLKTKTNFNESEIKLFNKKLG